jgi:hypothetical protein
VLQVGLAEGGSLGSAHDRAEDLLGTVRLGHSDIGFTLRQYTHLMPEHHRLPAAGVVAALFPADTSCDQTCDHDEPETQGAPPERGSDLRFDGGGGGI